MSERTAHEPLLHAEHLSISYRVNGRWLPALRDFAIRVPPGEIVGIVGESGSGKSTAALGLMRYLPPNGRVEPGGRVAFGGVDLLALHGAALRRIWGTRLALVPQNPGAALNPSLTVGAQVAEGLRVHGGLSAAAARARAVEMLRRVQLADPAGVFGRYPHELSGGMQQRVLIALALAPSPELLILDEPTTALDVTTEAAILDLLRDLIRAEGAGAVYVTHNLGVVAHLCQRAVVLYAGEIMEEAGVEELFGRSVHPYTIGLLHSAARLGATKQGGPLPTLAGRPPALADLPPGCVFEPRCPLAIPICRTKPPLERAGAGRWVRCHRWREIAAGAVAPDYGAQPAAVRERAGLPDRARLLTVEGLTKYFPVRPTLGQMIRGERPAPVRAVDGVNLAIQQGRTLGLVGESGSGKTTLARVVVGLEDRTSGRITLAGADVVGSVHDRDRATLARLQMVFQNPQESLNPYLTIGEALRRPLLRLGKRTRAEAAAEVERLLRAVSLDPALARRYPAELSGGEKQRVAIARAFASDPALILCDEPVSSLDVSVQAAVLNLLAGLQRTRDTAYLFISHDLAVVGYLADYLAVMYLGELFEVGYAADMFHPPYHPYTEALVSAIPRPDPAAAAPPVRLLGEPASARALPTGCRFHTRCPRKLGPICEVEPPPWRDDGGEHWVRCHRTLDDLRGLQRAVVDEGEGE